MKRACKFLKSDLITEAGQSHQMHSVRIRRMKYYSDVVMGQCAGVWPAKVNLTALIVGWTWLCNRSNVCLGKAGNPALLSITHAHHARAESHVQFLKWAGYMSLILGDSFAAPLWAGPGHNTYFRWFCCSRFDDRPSLESGLRSSPRGEFVWGVQTVVGKGVYSSSCLK